MFKVLKQLHYKKLVYIHRKTSAVLLKMRKFSPANLSPFTVHNANFERPKSGCNYQLMHNAKYKWYWIIAWRYHKDITGSQFCCSSSSILDYTCSGQEQYGRWCEPSPQYPLMPVVHQSSTVAVQLGLYCWSVTTCGEWQKQTLTRARVKFSWYNSLLSYSYVPYWGFLHATKFSRISWWMLMLQLAITTTIQ